MKLIIVGHLDKFLNKVVAERIPHQQRKLLDRRPEDYRSQLDALDLHLKEATAALVLRQRRRVTHQLAQVLIREALRAFQSQTCRPQVELLRDLGHRLKSINL